MKKLINTLLASAMALTLIAPSTVSAMNFSDVSSTHWGKDYINFVTSNGFMEGTGNGRFQPEKEMTYAEFAVVVVNGAFGGETIVNAGDTHWGDPYLNVLIENNLLRNGQGGEIVTTWVPWKDTFITREDVASILARLMDKGNFASGNLDNYPEIKNSNLALGQAQDVADVIDNNLMTGTGSDFGLYEDLSRAAACVIIQRATENGVFSSFSGTTPEVVPPVVPEVQPEIVPPTPEVPTTPSTPKPDDVVLGSGQYDVNRYNVPADTNKDGWLTYKEVDDKMKELEAKNPIGSAWGSDKYYEQNFTLISPTQGRPVSGGYGCAAFAFMISDEIFGNLPARRVTATLNDNPREVIRPGDISYGAGINHWWVMKEEYLNWMLNDDFASDYYDEANMDDYLNRYVSWSGNSSGKILSGGQEYDKVLNEVVNGLYHFTRYPAP